MCGGELERRQGVDCISAVGMSVRENMCRYYIETEGELKRRKVDAAECSEVTVDDGMATKRVTTLDRSKVVKELKRDNGQTYKLCVEGYCTRAC